MAYLVASGDHRFKLGNDAMTLGTDPKADINITRGFDVAPSHVALEPRDQGHVLKPLSGSNYVTFVNDIRAEFPTVLEHDDHIKVGLLELRYQNPTIELSPTLQQTPTGEHSDNRPSKLTHNVLEKLTTEKPVRKVNHRQEAERKTKKAWAVLTFVAVSVCAAAIYFQWKTNQRNQTITDEPDARNPELLYELKKIPMPEPFLVWAGCGFQNPSPEWRRVPPKVVPTDADVCYVHPDKDKTFSLKVGRLDTWASFPEVMSEIERMVPRNDPSAELIGKRRPMVGEHEFREISYTLKNGKVVHHRWVLVTDIGTYRFATFGPAKYQEVLRQDGLRFLSGFRFLTNPAVLSLERP